MRELSSMCYDCSLCTCIPTPSRGQAQAGSLECGWQQPPRLAYLLVVFPDHLWRARLEVEQLVQELVPI